MLIYAIDPGTTSSAVVIYDTEGRRVMAAETTDNETHLSALTGNTGVLVVEQIRSYGMAIGSEVLDTVWWAGRFHEAWGSKDYRFQLPRRDVKLHLCGSARAKDANVRQAILDRFGGKAAAIGTKAAPGPLHGIKAHEFAALAVALTWADTRAGGK